MYSRAVRICAAKRSVGAGVCCVAGADSRGGGGGVGGGAEMDVEVEFGSS